MSLKVYDEFVKKYGRLPTEFDPDYWEMLRMSKYRILAVPDLKPGKCANCGSSKDDGRKYIDFGLEVDWFGIVFLCGLCLKDVSTNMGLFHSYEEEVQLAQLKLLKLTNLQEQGTELKETVLKTFEEVKEYFDNLRSVGDNSSSDTSSPVGTDKKSDASGVSSDEPSTDTTKRTTAKSTTVTGSTNLPSLAELLNT